MTYKAVLVHVDLSDDMLVRAEAAVDIARQFEAAIRGSAGGLPPRPIVSDTSGRALAAIVDADQERIAAELSHAGDRFLSACSAVSDMSCCVAIREPTDLLMSQASACDLIVVTRPHETDPRNTTMGV
jgi:nucleotide-binding universal stress UspA family protein